MDDSSIRRSALWPNLLLGVHAGLQNTTPHELRDVWRRIESLGFDWISIFDHLYSANGTGGTHCLEAVSMHALLAETTRHVQCGCLVYVPSYRHPAILAKSMVTVDALSEGRVVLGLGAGWHRREYESFGIDFLSRRERLSHLSEAYDCIDMLVNQNETPAKYQGTYFTLQDAHCTPGPLGTRLPLWIGGGGERFTLRIAARADGWNVPFVSPDVFARKRAVLERYCYERQREVSDVVCSVNIGLAWSDDDLSQQFGRNAHAHAPAVLQGSTDRMQDLIGRYVDAGADHVNIAIRPRQGLGHQLEEFDRLAEVLQLMARTGSV